MNTPDKLPGFQGAKYGSYIILPLKYEAEKLKTQALDALALAAELTTMDLSENVKSMFSPGDPGSVGTCRRISGQTLLRGIFGAGDPGVLSVKMSGRTYPFELADSYLYVFRTQTAFLCLGLTFDGIETLDAICNPGYAENPAVFTLRTDSGEQTFHFEEQLAAFYASLGLQNFYERGRIMLEAYTYSLVLTAERFPSLESLRRVVFNLHQMVPPDTPAEDESEADVRYVYAVKDQSLGSYRWGCCVSSQTISYAIASPSLDLTEEMAAQGADGLPLVVLALYEKYTCLRFTQLLVQAEHSKHDLQHLRSMMLAFQTYGTVAPANLSRWHNVKQIYADILEVCDIPAAIADITGKLAILTEHQQALESTRNETIINLITIFGIVSILASVLSILQILSSGGAVYWISIVITTLALCVAFAFAFFPRE